MFGSTQLWDFPHLSAGSHGRSKATSIHEQQGLRLCGLHAKRVTLWSVQSRVTKPGPGLLTPGAAQEKAGLEAHVSGCSQDVGSLVMKQRARPDGTEQEPETVLWRLGEKAWEGGVGVEPGGGAEMPPRSHP